MGESKYNVSYFIQIRKNVKISKTAVIKNEIV